MKYFVEPGKVVGKFHEVNAYRQSVWLKIFFVFNTDKRVVEKMTSMKLYLNPETAHSMARQWKTSKTD